MYALTEVKYNTQLTEVRTLAIKPGKCRCALINSTNQTGLYYNTKWDQD